ncbi:U2 snRNP [Malassezia pachydermatis]
MSELRYWGNPQLEHLHAKYTGTIHPDITKHEWAVHQHRDTNAAVIAQGPLLSYMAIADGETRARTQFRLCENMLQPCGPPPERQELI